MSGLDNYDQYSQLDPIEEADKFLGMAPEEWGPPLTKRENMLLQLLRDVREALEEETGL